MYRIAAGVLALVASPALAQNSTTNCSQIGNQVQCNTSQTQNPRDFIINNTPVPNFAEAFAQGQREEEERQARQVQQDAQRADLIAKQNKTNWETDQAASRDLEATYAKLHHEQVGQYLADGECDKAIKFALSTGDIELANQAKAYCAAPAAVKQVTRP